jgi:phosphoribosylformimino-5-aminoimidazole carboxamide ribotide isomerase
VDLYPAIDLLGGRVVRLHQGDYDAVTDYGDDPAAVAASFAEQGARWIHVVDLDAARTGEPVNRSAIEAVVAASGDDRVEASGGVRDEATADALLAAGAARVVLGTAAVSDPPLVGRLAARHPGGIAVGLDGRGGEVAVRGWTAGSGETVLDLVARFEGDGVGAFVVTDISRDGTLGGPDLRGLAAVLGATDVPVVASGGVGSLDDLRALASLEAGGRRLAGAIVGRAIHDGRFTVADALAAVDSGTPGR